MPNQFLSPEGDLEDYFVDEYWLIDQYVGDTLWTWGNNAYGQLGINNTTNRSIPVTTFAGGTNWKQVAGGTYHTAAIKTDGTLWTWGLNNNGQLGDNTTTNRRTPVVISSGATNWKQVAGGGYHTAAIKTDGTLWTWGNNAYGQLGINAAGATNRRTTPVQTFAGGSDWKQVTCGVYHTAAIKTDGTLWTWGLNSYGQLGVNDTTNRNTPVVISSGATNWKQVTCGGTHTAAIKTDGTLWTWGYNSNGQLGDNTTTNRRTPVVISSGATNWKQVDGGGSHTAAIKTDGTLWTWGRNYTGELGINVAGATNGRTTPVQTFAGGTNWKQVACKRHTVAIKTDGTLWTWGNNAYGQLGINNIVTTLIRCTPGTTFAGGTNWKQVVCNGYYTAAVTSGTDPTYFIS